MLKVGDGYMCLFYYSLYFCEGNFLERQRKRAIAVEISVNNEEVLQGVDETSAS